MFFFSHNLETAPAAVNLGVLGINAAKGGSLAVGELVHGSLSNVEASASVVHSKDVDGVAVVGEAEALAALRAVPAGNALVTTNAGEAGEVALGREAVDEAVGSVRAADNVHAAVGVIVTGVVADSDGGSQAGEAENGSRDGRGELHGVGWVGLGWIGLRD